jgi:hypothetical protein
MLNTSTPSPAPLTPGKRLRNRHVTPIVTGQQQIIKVPAPTATCASCACRWA